MNAWNSCLALNILGDFYFGNEISLTVLGGCFGSGLSVEESYIFPSPLRSKQILMYFQIVKFLNTIENNSWHAIFYGTIFLQIDAHNSRKTIHPTWMPPLGYEWCGIYRVLYLVAFVRNSILFPRILCFYNEMIAHVKTTLHANVILSCSCCTACEWESNTTTTPVQCIIG